MCNKINNIDDLIKLNKENSYLCNFQRIKNGKGIETHLNGYKESYVKDMIEHFEKNREYDKSSYLNLKLHGFKY